MQLFACILRNTIKNIQSAEKTSLTKGTDCPFGRTNLAIYWHLHNYNLANQIWSDFGGFWAIFWEWINFGPAYMQGWVTTAREQLDKRNQMACMTEFTVLMYEVCKYPQQTNISLYKT